jgi:hypothetical protein
MANSKRRMLLVTYDVPLTTNANQRKAISDAIQAFGPWWHYLSSSWLVVTDKDANTVGLAIGPHVKATPSGKLLVVEVDPSAHQGLLPKDAWDWINTWARNLKAQP